MMSAHTGKQRERTRREIAGRTKRVLMVTDGGKKIGMGHVMRSLSIAHALKIRGFEISFMVSNEDSAVDAVVSKGFNSVTHEISSQDTGEACDYDAAVFDTKRNISEDIRHLKASGVKIIIIDSLSTGGNKADCMIIPSLLKKASTELPDVNVIYQGIKYFPLHHEFLRAGDVSKEKRSSKLRILVSMGGADPNNLTFKVVRALVNTRGIEMKVVVGPSMQLSKQLSNLLADDRLVFGADVKKMASLMLDADIAFSAFGITLFELAFMGVPSIVIANYREDKEDMAVFGQSKVGIPLGYYGDVSDADIENAVALFLQNKGLLENMSRNGRNLIDGKGAERISEIIEEICSA